MIMKAKRNLKLELRNIQKSDRMETLALVDCWGKTFWAWWVAFMKPSLNV